MTFSKSFAEDALTIKQQLDRITEEIKDLNKAVFNKSFDNENLNSLDDWLLENYEEGDENLTEFLSLYGGVTVNEQIEITPFVVEALPTVDRVRKSDVVAVLTLNSI